MKIRIKLDIHAYVQEQLCDEVFDDAPWYGINGPEIMGPLSKKRNHEMVFEYTEQTCLSEVVNAVKYEIWGDSKEGEMAGASYSFLVDNERYYIVDEAHNFVDILSKYVDPDQAGIITICVLMSCDAGGVASEGPLRYYVHSHESGSHHEAHIHVRDNAYEYEASIRISDGEIIAGELPSKYAKMAKKKILSDQEYFYNCWNTMTDGLQVDINHHYGYIKY